MSGLDPYKAQKNYLNYLSSYPNLSKEEEELLLSDRFHEPNYKQLIQSHMKMVLKEATRYSKYGGPISVEDLVQEGVLGLIRAIEGYDKTHNARFSTYARWWVKALIQEHLLMYVHAIKNQQKRTSLLNQYNTTQKAININCEDVCVLTNSALPEYNSLLEDSIFFEVFPDPDTDIEAEKFQMFLYEQRKKWLKKALKYLNKQEIFIVQRVYLQTPSLSLSEVAGLLGITAQRTRTLLLKALRKLRLILAQHTSKLQRYY